MIRRIALSFIWLIVIVPFAADNGFGHSKKQAAQHGFKDTERWVAMFEDPARESWQKPDDVVRMIQIKPGDVIADIGAGTGYFTRRFALAVGSSGKALGLDIEPGMISYMEEDAEKRGLKNYEARLVEPDDPGLSPGSVDIIFICDTYHHIEDRIRYLINLKDALRPDGRIVIVDFYKKEAPVGPPLEMKLSEETVQDEFFRAGYRLKSSKAFLPYQYYLEFEPDR